MIRRRGLPILLALGCAATRAPAPSPAANNPRSDTTVAFVISVAQTRTHTKSAAHLDRIPTLTFDDEQTVHGRLTARRSGADHRLEVRLDSMSFAGRKPFAFETFMSADTMISRSANAPNVEAGRHAAPAYEEMLDCLFSRVTAVARFDARRRLVGIDHPGGDCPSGEYTRLNFPAVLSAFCLDAPATRLGDKWTSRRVLPSFSGAAFYPEVNISCRALARDDESITVVVAVDTVLQNVTFLLPAGDSSVVVEDRIRLRGTVVTSTATGDPTSGELRIRETVESIRPRTGHATHTRSGEARIRFETRRR